MSKKRVPRLKNPFNLEANPRGNYRRPTLKASLNYIKRHKDKENLSTDQKLRLLEAYRIVDESKKRDPESLKKAKISTKEDRGNYIKPTIAAARRYLESVKDYSVEQKSKPDIAWRITEAEMIVAAANRKNQRRRQKRSGAVAPTQQVAVPRTTTIKREKHVTKWEEVLGPDGEIVRFRLDEYTDGPNKGKFKARVLTRDEPQVGDLVLDSTEGLKAWKITSTRRRPHPITPAMRETYETSLVFKVRQLAAGKVSMKQFVDHVNNLYSQVGNQRTV